LEGCLLIDQNLDCYRSSSLDKDLLLVLDAL
jgi:hypothetical protein